MLKSAWTICRVAGIPIRLHISLLLALPIFAWIFGTNLQFFTETLDFGPQDLMLNPYLLGFFLGLGLFFSIALHELGHSLIALHRGNKIKGITLMLLGGIAHLEDISSKPSDEWHMAIMGPLVSLVLGSGMLAAGGLFDRGPNDLQLFFLYLGQLNIFLALFNLLPAFPSDGGRVLRALLAKRRSFTAATRTAVSIGQGFAIVFGIIGLFSGNIFLVLVGIFIYISGSQEYQSTLLKSTLSEFLAEDLMTEDVVTVSPYFTVTQLLNIIYEQKHTGYPVVDEGEVQGLVTMDDIRKVEPKERDDYQVRHIMSERLHKVHPKDELIKCLKIMTTEGIGRLLVFEDDKPVGILTRSDILKGFKLRQIEDMAT